MDNKKILNQFCSYLKGKGISNKQIAERVGIKKQNLCNYKKGDNKVTTKFLNRVLKANGYEMAEVHLPVTVEEMIWNEGETLPDVPAICGKVIWAIVPIKNVTNGNK